MSMRPLGLDFARDSSRSGALGLILLVVGAAGAIAVAAQIQTLDAERSDLEARKTAAERSAKRTQPPGRDAQADKAIGEELAKVNGLLAQIGVPWEALFAELEAAGGQEIALTNVQPDNAGRQIRVGGEAKNFAALVQYVKRLEARDAMADVYLASHEVRAANQSVAFVVNAKWVRP